MAAKIYIYLFKSRLKEASLVFLKLRTKKFNGDLIVYFHNVMLVALAEKY